MDILATLRNQSDELLPCDLALMKDELFCGSYPADYVKLCLGYMDELTRKFARGSRGSQGAESQGCDESSCGHNGESARAPEVSIRNGVFVDPAVLASHRGAAVQDQELSPDKAFEKVLAGIRAMDGYKDAFKSFMSQPAQCTEECVERYFSRFTNWELSAILACVPLSEAFLERHYGSLDKKALATHQLFSEEFFIKHFADLDAATVLRKGKNPWRAKEARSTKLDVFLRLRGVQF